MANGDAVGQMLNQRVGDAKVRKDMRKSPVKETSVNQSGAPAFYALSVATVMRVDYEGPTVDLRLQTGETFPRTKIPLTFAGAGHRHILGSVPMVGDVCLVGWGTQESGHTRKPWIVSWILPGATAGYDWVPTQPFGTDEYGSSPKSRHQLEGVADRKRHKLRHMEPGNVFGSSAQGADLVLNEGVLLSNRRGGEIHLRDQDNALVTRSLQQFHAGAGFRVYAGMVQRDATFLPSQMFSDGTYWDAPRQQDADGNLITQFDLGDDPYPRGFLTPAGVFQRDADYTPLTDLSFPATLDPYDFLQNGLYISAEGYFQGSVTSDAIYGGKPMFRVSTDGSNAIVDTDTETLTEYRIEVAHTADGTLPVTEQTDGLDANRLPSGTPRAKDPLGGAIDAPFIEFVMGTVVGNDPYSEDGRGVYGVPLRPVIFDGEVRSPAMVIGAGEPLETHAASLFRMTPPGGILGDPTFWSVTKDGRVMASFAGPGGSWSAEVALGAGMRLGSGTNSTGHSLMADMDGAIALRARRGDNQANTGISLSSDKGSIYIYGGGSTQEGGLAARTAPSGDGEGALPAITLESGTNILLRAKAGQVRFEATKLNFSNVQQMEFNANSTFNIQSGDGISMSSNTATTTTTGKSSSTFSGPKGGNPANGPVKSTQIIANPATGFPGGPADTYFMLYGDKVEAQTAGNHFTTIVVGNRSYSIGGGTYTVVAGPSALALAPGGASLGSGGAVLVASGGATTISAGAAVNILTPSFLTMFIGAMTINGPAPGVPHSLPFLGQIPGGILTDGCSDPITGFPFSLGGTLGIQTLRVN